MDLLTITLSKDQADKLETLSLACALSREALVDKAIETLLEMDRAQKKHRVFFGLLKDEKIDGLKLQQGLRSEWEAE